MQGKSQIMTFLFDCVSPIGEIQYWSSIFNIELVFHTRMFMFVIALTFIVRVTLPICYPVVQLYVLNLIIKLLCMNGKWKATQSIQWHMSKGLSIEADAIDRLVFFPYFFELLCALRDLPKILLPAGCISNECNFFCLYYPSQMVIKGNIISFFPPEFSSS